MSCDNCDAKTEAEKMFQCNRTVLSLESDLEDLLCSLGLPGESIAWDGYDLRLEFVGCEPELRLSKEQQTALSMWGFQRVWLYHTDMYETYYVLSTAYGYKEEQNEFRRLCKNNCYRHKSI